MICPVYSIRNKLIDHEDEIAKISSEDQREALRQSAEDAEEWMFDEGYTADLKTYDEKYVELSTPAEKMFFRLAELAARPKTIEALKTKLDKVGQLIKKWEETMTHITEEERTEVLEKVAEVRKWIEEKVEEQEKSDPTADPVFTSGEVPGQTKQIEGIVARLMKKPKPKPVEKKNETESDEKEEEVEEGESSDEKKEETEEGEAGEEAADAEESEETTEGEKSEETAEEEKKEESSGEL